MSAAPSIITTPEGSATTCVVACKLPHGLQLQLKNKDGAISATFKAKGSNDARIVGGYGMTEGIPTAFMEEWLRRNAAHPAVLNKSIFMHTSGRSAEAQAKEQRTVRTGLEAINPVDDARAKGLTVDKEAELNYRKQMADNPLRNRQIVE